ncbi:citrate lyase holo-[acyl-carrier protein] synthase [Archangium sp.]|uniref:citrate lyase holo-[acyl-carrier protein] synthase n=1 Tax=Archangium sp. TaxID=1872627 RepID=UPI002D34657A|nr:citrate lyase holo-[acyl-carrier protein] synthase [Archangium sp.]HYO53905.1 citrate lyase holo-[acyl-carrier protein] synthase [Archangium sp.]
MSTALAKRALVRTEEARVLAAREHRNKLRQGLARSVSGRSLVELSLDVPRGAASNEDAEHLFLHGLQRLEQELGVAPAEMFEDAAGYYSLFVTQLPALLARRRASHIEGEATWDRYLNIECYGLAGSLGLTGKVPREAVGGTATR